MNALAARINAWFSPSARKALYAAVALAGTVAVVWGATSTIVAAWTALVLAVGGLASGILASIMARRADVTGLYALTAAVIAALVVLRFVNPAMAQQIDQTLAAVVTALGALTYMRTDTGTHDGAPTAEVILTDAVADPGYVPILPTTTANADNTVTDVDPAGVTTITPGV
jgi:hypothetical protein